MSFCLAIMSDNIPIPDGEILARRFGDITVLMPDMARSLYEEANGMLPERHAFYLPRGEARSGTSLGLARWRQFIRVLDAMVFPNGDPLLFTGDYGLVRDVCLQCVCPTLLGDDIDDYPVIAREMGWREDWIRARGAISSARQVGKSVMMSAIAAALLIVDPVCEVAFMSGSVKQSKVMLNRAVTFISNNPHCTFDAGKYAHAEKFEMITPEVNKRAYIGSGNINLQRGLSPKFTFVDEADLQHPQIGWSLIIPTSNNRDRTMIMASTLNIDDQGLSPFKLFAAAVETEETGGIPGTPRFCVARVGALCEACHKLGLGECTHKSNYGSYTLSANDPMRIKRVADLYIKAGEKDVLDAEMFAIANTGSKRTMDQEFLERFFGEYLDIPKEGLKYVAVGWDPGSGGHLGQISGAAIGVYENPRDASLPLYRLLGAGQYNFAMRSELVAPFIERFYAALYASGIPKKTFLLICIEGAPADASVRMAGDMNALAARGKIGPNVILSTVKSGTTGLHYYGTNCGNTTKNESVAQLRMLSKTEPVRRFGIVHPEDFFVVGDAVVDVVGRRVIRKDYTPESLLKAYRQQVTHWSSVKTTNTRGLETTRIVKSTLHGDDTAMAVQTALYSGCVLLPMMRHDAKSGYALAYDIVYGGD